MRCPNCGKDVPPAHDNGCVIGALFGVLEDREVDLSGVTDLNPIPLDRLWERWLDGAVAELADSLDLPRYGGEEADERDLSIRRVQ